MIVLHLLVMAGCRLSERFVAYFDKFLFPTDIQLFQQREQL